MKRLLTALVVLTLMSCACGCALQDQKSQIKFNSGELKTVWGLTKDDGHVSYYITKDDAYNLENKVTVPLSSVKEITEISEK